MDPLRSFLYLSRQWSRASDGSELFHMASQALQEVANVDAGFFVYPNQSIAEFTPAVYASWGVFSNIEESLKLIMLEDVMNGHDEGNPLMERWTRAEDMPVALQVTRKRLGLLYIGIWPLDSQGQSIGAIIAARIRPTSDPLSGSTSTTLMDVCAAQISLALDFVLAVQCVFR